VGTLARCSFQASSAAPFKEMATAATLLVVITTAAITTAAILTMNRIQPCYPLCCAEWEYGEHDPAELQSLVVEVAFMTC
jgi:hypothetical protein